MWLSDILKKKRNYSPQQNCNIFITCFPKSGSTYLENLLCEITGFEQVGAIQTYGGMQYWYNDQDIDGKQLEIISSMNSVTKQHAKGTEHNITFLKKFNIKPVVLVRNIYDTLMSLYDHIENEDHRQPMGYIHKEYFKMSRGGKIDFLIKTHIPWYFNFLMSWREASQRISPLWITYEELFADQVKEIEKILDFYKIHKDGDHIKSAIHTVKNRNNRFNKGITARGNMLSKKK